MKIGKRIIAGLMALALVFSMAGCSSVGKNLEDNYIDNSIRSAGKYLVKKMTTPRYGDEIALVALLRSEYIDYWHNRAEVYESKLNNMISRNGYVLGENNQIYVEGYPNVIFAFTAIGKYADKTSANNLMEGISYDSVVLEGGYVNKIWALTALESGDYELMEQSDLSRDKYIDFVLDLQKEDGSFGFAGMKDSRIYVTAIAVTALAETGEARVQDAVKRGAVWLMNHARTDDSIRDLSMTIVALNTAGISAEDFGGDNLVQRLVDRQRSDGSFSENPDDKNGNNADTGMALLGLASQHRFNRGITTVFDMSDVLGGTHNKLSPMWKAYIGVVKYFIAFMVCFLIGLYILSRIRVKRWTEQGIYDPVKGRMYTDEELAEKKRREERAAQRLAEEEREYEASHANDNGGEDIADKPTDEITLTLTEDQADDEITADESEDEEKEE